MDRAELFREIQEDEEMAQKIYYYEKMMPLVEERIMGKSLHPLGFSVACHLIVYDLAKGVDGFTGKPMQKVPLIGHPLLGIQKSDCRKLAEKMYGTEYANQMQRDY